MRLGDIINFGGRNSSFPVHPILLNWLGVNEAVFLCRISWWQSNEEDWICKSAKEIQAETGLSYKVQLSVRTKLVEMGILQQDYARLEHEMRFRIIASALQNNVTLLTDQAPPQTADGEIPKQQVAPPQTAGGTSPNGSSLLKVRLNKDIVDPEFARFWQLYPRKVSKPQAQKAWLKAIQKSTPEQIRAGVVRYKSSPQWQKDGGQFIPHPATWLNGERWADEIQPQMQFVPPPIPVMRSHKGGPM